MKTNFKAQRVRSEKHRRFISQLPCVACRIGGYSQCAHIGRGGMGLKNGDDLTVSLCCQRPNTEGCHAEQHRVGEEKFWQKYGGIESAKTLARNLFEVSGDWAAACELLVKFGRKV